MKHFRELWILSAAILFANAVTAQSPQTVASNATGVKPFSPSVTSFKISGDLHVVAAYAYPISRTGGIPDHRTVGVSASVNGGTWSILKNELQLPAGYDNMDDPELICIGGQKLVCVVRAFQTSGRIAGESYPSVSNTPYLPGTIFGQAALFLTVSTDGGANWGYYDQTDLQSTTLYTGTDAGKVWKKIVSVDADLTTVEHPRIAYRPGFDNKGYIVWNEKEWTATGSKLHVSSCSVGIAAFSASSGANDGNNTSTNHSASDGRLLEYATGNGYLSVAAADGCFGPESPSVAVSPDAGIWMSFEQTQYLPQSGELWDGSKAPDASVFVTKGSCSLSEVTYSGTLKKFVSSFSFPSGPVLIATDEVPGFYNQNRGYLYDNDNSKALYDVNLSQGSSIQVAMANPLACSISYQVGLVTVFASGSDLVNSWLVFWSANIPSGQDASYFHNHIDQQHVTGDMYEGTAFGDRVDADGLTSEPSIRFFPKLAYTNVKDDYLKTRPDGTANTLPRSFFVLSWMYMHEPQNSARNPDTTQCRTAVSFDNKSFTLTQQSSPIVVVGYRRPAEAEANAANVSGYCLGDKIGVCGDAGDFSVNVVWHNVRGLPSQESFLANSGGCVLIKPHLTDYPDYDLGAIPDPSRGEQVGFFSSDGSSSSFPWTPYAYFDFGNANRPLGSDIKKLGTYTPTTHFGLPNSSPNVVSYTYSAKINNVAENTITPPSSVIPNGIYYADYSPSTTGPSDPNDVYTFLNQCNQRRMVMTQGHSHTVTERWNVPYVTIPSSPRMNRVVYSFDGGTPSEIAGTDDENTGQCWPSIGVYQQGNGNDCNGRWAIAITWVEYADVTKVVSGQSVEGTQWTIKMVTQEYDLCGGDFPGMQKWSSPYVIHTHFTPMSWAPREAMWDFTEPVIAPIVTPVEGTPTTGQPRMYNDNSDRVQTNLIGWTVTWVAPDPQSNPAKRPSVWSRSWLRWNGSNGIARRDNSNWGTYPSIGAGNMWPPGAPDVLGSRNLLLDANATFNLTSTPDAYFVFPTVTNTENKTYWWDNEEDASDNYRQQVAVTSEIQDYGLTPAGNPFTGKEGSGVYVLSVRYGRKANSAAGHLISQSPPVNLCKLPQSICSMSSRDRYPSITVNSFGQVGVSWEHGEFVHASDGPHIRSAIQLALTSKAAPTDWPTANLHYTLMQTNLTPGESAGLIFTLRNPSISGFPKTRFNRQDANQGALDLGAIEMAFTRERTPSGGAVTELYDAIYCKVPLAPPSREMFFMPNLLPTTGFCSHKSFGTYNGGIGFPTQGLPTVQGFSVGNNDATSIVYRDQGAAKGTYEDTPAGDQYRSEKRRLGCAEVGFTYGKVSLTSVAGTRVVMPNSGENITGYASVQEMRDSIFHTDVFDLEPGDTLTYWRGLSYSDSTQIYPGGMLYDSAVRANYVVRLVGLDGHTDVIETLTFDPHSGLSFIPKHVKVANTSGIERDAYLQVDMSYNNIPDDSSCDIAREVWLNDPNMASPDTTFSLKPAEGRLNADSRFSLLRPNPVLIGEPLQLAFTGIPAEAPVRIDLIDPLGRIVSAESYPTHARAGIFKLSAPNSAGMYSVRVRFANSEEIESLVVLK